MKIRLTGFPKEFENFQADTLDRTKFLSYRSPQKGSNPRYKPGGDKYDPDLGEALLMYIEVDMPTLKKIFRPLRKPKVKLLPKRTVVTKRKTISKTKAANAKKPTSKNSKTKKL